MGQVRQFMLGVLDRADVGKHRNVLAEPPLIVANEADRLPLRVDLRPQARRSCRRLRSFDLQANNAPQTLAPSDNVFWLYKHS